MTKKWDKRFMGMAKFVSSWSKDRGTKVGAVIVNDEKKVLSLGFNGFPRGVNDNKKERHKSPAKHEFTVHAERNAIDEAETSLRGATLYCTFFTCSGCAQGVIQKKLKKVVAPEPDWDHPRYGPGQRAAMEMYEEAGVEVQFYELSDTSLVAFWEIGCGGGKVHDIITDENFMEYVEMFKHIQEDRGIEIEEYKIDEENSVIEYFVANGKNKYLYFGEFELNNFTHRRDK